MIHSFDIRVDLSNQIANSKVSHYIVLHIDEKLPALLQIRSSDVLNMVTTVKIMEELES